MRAYPWPDARMNRFRETSMEREMLARPERFFADRFGLNAGTMERLLGSTLARRGGHAGLFLGDRLSEELVLEEGSVKKAARHVSQGAGVRAQSGERTGYAHTDDLALPNLEEAARQARAIADQSGTSAVVAVGPVGKPHDLYTLVETPIAAGLGRKGSLLQQAGAGPRALRGPPPSSAARWACSIRWTRRRARSIRGCARSSPPSAARMSWS